MTHKNKVIPKNQEYTYSAEIITEQDIQSFSKIVIKKNKSVHNLLLFSLYYSKNNPNQPITIDHINQLNTKLFSTKTKLINALKKLDKHQLIDYNPQTQTWETTTKGIRYLYYQTQKNMPKHKRNTCRQ